MCVDTGPFPLIPELKSKLLLWGRGMAQVVGYLHGGQSPVPQKKKKKRRRRRKKKEKDLTVS
jgi:hypothetical protein